MDLSSFAQEKYFFRLVGRRNIVDCCLVLTSAFWKNCLAYVVRHPPFPKPTGGVVHSALPLTYPRTSLTVMHTSTYPTQRKDENTPYESCGVLECIRTDVLLAHRMTYRYTTKAYAKPLLLTFYKLVVVRC